MKQNKEKLLKLAEKFQEEILKIQEKISWGDKIPHKWKFVPITDLSDYVKLCDIIQNRTYRKAFSFYRELDTASREFIPKYLVTELYKIE